MAKAYSHEFGKFGISEFLQRVPELYSLHILVLMQFSTAAQEAKNPQRDMPIGIPGSLGISTVYIFL